jgi:hypothetical protein
MKGIFEEDDFKKMEKIAPKLSSHLGDKSKNFGITQASLLRYLKSNEITYRKNGKELSFTMELCQKMVNYAGEVLGKINRVDEEFDDSDDEVNEENLSSYLLKKRDEALELGLVG